MKPNRLIYILFVLGVLSIIYFGDLDTDRSRIVIAKGLVQTEFDCTEFTVTKQMRYRHRTSETTYIKGCDSHFTFKFDNKDLKEVIIRKNDIKLSFTGKELKNLQESFDRSYQKALKERKEAKETYKFEINTSKANYKENDIIQIEVKMTDTKEKAYFMQEKFNLKIKGEQKTLDYQVFFEEVGVFTIEFPAKRLPIGTYDILLEETYFNDSAQLSFTIQ